MTASIPSLGYGLGLRSAYYQQILEESPDVDWFEVVSENFMVQGGKALYYLDAVAERYPLVMHGVSLSIGGPHALDTDYLQQLKRLAVRVKPAWISDHLCWSRGNAHQLHDLLPLPYTEESLDYIAARVAQVQDVLQRPLVLENVSSYVRAASDDFTEWEFLAALSRKSGCELLLDVNNVYVSSRNHGFDPWTFIQGLPVEKVRQLHLAGHSDYGDYVIDTHDQPVSDPVWALYQRTLERFGAVATLLERDDHFPPFGELLDELRKARELGEKVQAGRQQCA
ncbi:MNIO family bufferin maturase [Pseudomonas sp. EA_5y_Pfl2_R50]|uniref:MNIO family bufferin maturase n=1 Tax=Pseudomonas sp. EA_5y_Pfl2_R50 TaxID=3088691 RepID=UPI0030D7C2DC